MSLIFLGLGIGFSLTLMIGPITFTILDSSLSRGWRAGVLAGAGMWISEISDITLCYLGGQRVIDSIQREGVNSWMGVVAGLVLVGIAVTLWVKRHAQLGKARAELPSARNLAGHAGRGFLVNSFSPFTVIFWPSLVLTKALNTDMSHQSALLFFGSIIVALMIGDTLKAVFAEWIRRRLKDRYIRTSRIVFAIVFAAIGLYLLTRAMIALVGQT